MIKLGLVLLFAPFAIVLLGAFLWTLIVSAPWLLLVLAIIIGYWISNREPNPKP
jgi:uncharacterized membrane protein